MNSETLANLLKRLYKDFDVSRFEDRLKVQKFVYILQNRGIKLGYKFNFYLYGPYSTDLVRTAFGIQDYGSKGSAKFANPDVEKNFKGIITKISGHKDDIRWLEGAASILLLKEMGFSRDRIYRQLAKKRTPFEKPDVDAIWNELEKWGWIE